MTSQNDIQYMNHALTLARRGIGCVWPNPAVGCVIVRDGIVIGRGVTQRGGRPHAESEALAQAGEFARGADVYVTLEPCAHVGETGSCAMALIHAGVARVVVACGDPDERVAGRGLAMLRDAGIEVVEVVEGVMAEDARELNAGFLSRVERGRPFVTLKTASTLDGKSALENGESQWITGELARRHVHLERSRHDAILAGVETVVQDDPSLNVRLDGYKHSSVRVILDSNLRISEDAKLVQSAGSDPLWVVCKEGCNGSALEVLGVVVIPVRNMGIDTILGALAARGITRVFVEGGARVHTSFLRSGLYDQVLWYRAGKIIGDEGYSAVSGLGIESMSDVLSLKRQEIIVLGEDSLEIFAREE